MVARRGLSDVILNRDEAVRHDGDRILFLLFDGLILPATRLSDHASFWDAGWPAFMVTDTAFFRNPHYHLPSDRIDTLDFSFMAQLVESLELALFELPSVPQSGVDRS